MKQNYREDFILTLTLNSISEQFGGEPLAAFPQSFSIALQTTPAAAAVCASSTDGVLSGCHFAEDDPLALHIPIRGGSLMPGQLRGTFRCQVDDPCFPDGCRSLNIPFTTAITLVTDASENAELIPSTGVSLPVVIPTTDLLTLRASRQTFIDMWNDFGHVHFNGYFPSDNRDTILAKYDPVADRFIVNPGKGDSQVSLTYEEAVEVFLDSHAPTFPYIKCSVARALILKRNFINERYPDYEGNWWAFQVCRRLEVIGHPNLMPTFYVTSAFPTAVGLFEGCQSLRHIHMIVQIQSTGDFHLNAQAFQNCGKLVTLYLKGLRQNLLVHWSQSLSYESVNYMIENAVKTTNGFYIRFSDRIFKLIAGDYSRADAADVPQAERDKWLTIASKAAAKNITITK